jgi:hypothetical protein
MTAVVWERPTRRQKRRTQRDEIFVWVRRYADEMDGPTPSINEIALHFRLNYKTVYFHVMKLIVEGRLRRERGKLVVVGSEWIEPSAWPAQQRFDFGTQRRSTGNQTKGSPDDCGFSRQKQDTYGPTRQGLPPSCLGNCLRYGAHVHRHVFPSEAA